MASSTRSIGQVLTTLKREFDDVTITKIRYLESEGLISPERAPSGYRRYRDADLERLRYILRMQRDHYLPLKVIRQHVEMMDRGLTPATPDTPVPVAEVVPMEAAVPAAAPVVAAAGQPERLTIRLTRDELIKQSGISEAALQELERQLLIQPRRGTSFYGKDALTLAIVARNLAGFGMDARHLVAVKLAAEREVGLIEQAIAPMIRRGGDPRKVTFDATSLVAHAHAAFMRIAIDR